DAPAAGPAPAEPNAAPERPIEAYGRRQARGNGSWRTIPRRTQPLGFPESTSAREKLIAELGQLPSAEKLTDWAFQRMTIKNSLTNSDAHLVEQAFQERLSAVIELQPAVATLTNTHRPQD